MASHTEGHRQSWSVVRRDTDAERWQAVARDAFWLGSRAALDADRPGEPPGMGELSARFRRHGEELNVVEHDLTECLNEFKQAYEVLYRESSQIALKKFSIVHHDELGRPELGAKSRVRDLEDPIAAEVSAITDLPAIDRYGDRKADELLTVLEAIRTFRDTLYETLEDEVVKLIAKRAPETRGRLQPFVDLWNFRHGRGPLAE